MLRRATQILKSHTLHFSPHSTRGEIIKRQNKAPQHRPNVAVDLFNKIPNEAPAGVATAGKYQQLNAFINDSRKFLILMRNGELARKDPQHRVKMRLGLREYWTANMSTYFVLSQSVRQAAFICEIGLQDDELLLGFAECHHLLVMLQSVRDDAKKRAEQGQKDAPKLEPGTENRKTTFRDELSCYLFVLRSLKSKLKPRTTPDGQPLESSPANERLYREIVRVSSMAYDAIHDGFIKNEEHIFAQSARRHEAQRKKLEDDARRAGNRLPSETRTIDDELDKTQHEIKVMGKQPVRSSAEDEDPESGFLHPNNCVRAFTLLQLIWPYLSFPMRTIRGNRKLPVRNYEDADTQQQQPQPQDKGDAGSATATPDQRAKQNLEAFQRRLDPNLIETILNYGIKNVHDFNMTSIVDFVTHIHHFRDCVGRDITAIVSCIQRVRYGLDHQFLNSFHFLKLVRGMQLCKVRDRSCWEYLMARYVKFCERMTSQQRCWFVDCITTFGAKALWSSPALSERLLDATKPYPTDYGYAKIRINDKRVAMREERRHKSPRDPSTFYDQSPAGKDRGVTKVEEGKEGNDDEDEEKQESAPQRTQRKAVNEFDMDISSL